MGGTPERGTRGETCIRAPIITYCSKETGTERGTTHLIVKFVVDPAVLSQIQSFIALASSLSRYPAVLGKQQHREKATTAI